MDVSSGAYYVDAVFWAVNRGITKGTTETTFSPGNGCTRAHAVTFLWRADGSPEPTGGPMPFHDVVPGTYYEKAVRWAMEQGITGGIDESTFGPDRPCSRAQIVTFLHRFAGFPAVSQGAAFPDVPAGAYYADAVSWAAAQGITLGTADGRFQPSASCTRGQIVTFLYRYFAGEGTVSNSEEPSVPVSDSIPSTVTMLEPAPAQSAYEAAAEAIVLRETLLSVIRTVQDGGGYYTSHNTSQNFPRTAWQGIHEAFTLGGDRPAIQLDKARPSFCSSACYLVLMKALLDWDQQGVITEEAWRNLKPWCLDGLEWAYQHDGAGCWGRANANGPGMAVLLAQLGAGESCYIGGQSEYATRAAWLSAWDSAEPGDFLKIFWNSYIGADDTQKGKSESGHMVVFLGREVSYLDNGTRDDWISYWSSNGSGAQLNGGYGTSRCRASKIRRAVLSRVTDPAAFAKAAVIAPDNTDPWLSALDGRHLATVSELKTAITGADMYAWLH
ncbi:MAG: S-layer homology domain-containing protein [Oscillibacter sp.]|nr:S-layer homology domain-containing protein [Oscillibacter sp.]